MKIGFDNLAMARVCRAHGVAKLESFGSVLRADFRPDSDVDLLATLRPEAESRTGLLEWVGLREELADLFGRPVDLLSRPLVERSRNPFRKAAILNHTETLYAEG
ncbi:MAG TPA: nucleotidyltransferase domain-containing protein [Verrucomicrobiota bacterium]|nr:hypothetical protein [Verrucomicrobiales bacterium]HRI11881.1 nucleotidyltransferase domain-containing protein [Verrucomicrobiota bacterium]